jgi:hypothetical protein
MGVVGEGLLTWVEFVSVSVVFCRGGASVPKQCLFSFRYLVYKRSTRKEIAVTWEMTLFELVLHTALQKSKESFAFSKMGSRDCRYTCRLVSCLSGCMQHDTQNLVELRKESQQSLLVFRATRGRYVTIVTWETVNVCEIWFLATRCYRISILPLAYTSFTDHKLERNRKSHLDCLWHIFFPVEYVRRVKNSITILNEKDMLALVRDHRAFQRTKVFKGTPWYLQRYFGEPNQSP